MQKTFKTVRMIAGEGVVVPISKTNASVDKGCKIELRLSSCRARCKRSSDSERIFWSSCCKHFLYDPKGLSADALISLIWFREGVRPPVLYKRADGMILTCNCRAAEQEKCKRMFLLAGQLAGFICLVILAIQQLCAFASHHPLNELIETNQHQVQANVSRGSIAGINSAARTLRLRAFNSVLILPGVQRAQVAPPPGINAEHPLQGRQG